MWSLRPQDSLAGFGGGDGSEGRSIERGRDGERERCVRGRGGMRPGEEYGKGQGRRGDDLN